MEIKQLKSTDCAFMKIKTCGCIRARKICDSKRAFSSFVRVMVGDKCIN